MSNTPSSLVWSNGGASLVTDSPTMQLVVLGYMIPVAENNPDWTYKYLVKCKMSGLSNVLEMGKSAMRPSWTYKLGENIISIAKEEKDLGVVIQDNLSLECSSDPVYYN